MTEIERKALALVNEVSGEAHGLLKYTALSRSQDTRLEALCRAIERHEAFRQEVSDAVEAVLNPTYMPAPSEHKLRRFIITKPDPLLEAWAEAHQVHEGISKLETFRAALSKRGLEIKEKKDG